MSCFSMTGAHAYTLELRFGFNSDLRSSRASMPPSSWWAPSLQPSSSFLNQSQREALSAASPILRAAVFCSFLGTPTAVSPVHTDCTLPSRSRRCRKQPRLQPFLSALLAEALVFQICPLVGVLTTSVPWYGHFNQNGRLCLLSTDDYVRPQR